MLGVSVKTLIALAIGLVRCRRYVLRPTRETFKLQRSYPNPQYQEPSSTLRMNLVRSTIMSNAKNIEEMKTQLDKIENRIFELR